MIPRPSCFTSRSAGNRTREVVRALCETKSMTELCQEHDLHANQIIDWKRQLIEGATGVFGAPHQWPKPWTPASSFFGAESGGAGWIATFEFGGQRSCPLE